MMLFDRPFQVGDRVSFEGQYGDITAIGLRTVRLQTLDDNTVTIPNNMFLSSVTSCGNYGALHMQVVVDVHVGVDQDVHKARALVQEACATSPYAYLPKPIVVLISQVIIQSYFATQLRLKAYVLDTKYEKAFETDVTLRVLEASTEDRVTHIPVSSPIYTPFREIFSAKTVDNFVRETRRRSGWGAAKYQTSVT